MPSGDRNHLGVNAVEPATEPEAAPRAARLLMGSSQWHPGQRIEVVRPPVSASFLAVGCGFCGGAAALAVFLLQQASTEPLPALSRTLGVLGLGTLAATATIVYLQGLWPRRRMTLDWTAGVLETTIGAKRTEYVLDDVKNVVLRLEHLHTQLDIQLSGTAVRLFDSDDHGLAAASLPMDRLESLAEDLSKALSVPLVHGSAEHEPVTTGFVWNSASRLARVGLGIVLATLVSYGFGVFGSLTLAFALVASAAAVGIVCPIAFTSSSTPKPAERLVRAKPNIEGILFLASGVSAAIVCAFILVWLPLTTAGTVVAGIFLAVFVPFCLLAPDMVLSQRSGVMIGGLHILSLRLRMFPVRTLIHASADLRKQGLHCPMSAITSAYAASSGYVRYPRELAEAVKDAAQRGEVDLLPRRGPHAEHVKLPSPDYHDWRFLLGSLLVSLFGLAVIGFFFVACDGHVYSDILLIRRDWEEVPATITKIIPGGRSYSPKYYFNYQVGGQPHSAMCYGPTTWDEERAVRARYDRNVPELAVLVGGQRFQSLPFLPVLLGSLLLLIIFILPMLLGHIVAQVCSLAKTGT